MEPLSPHAAAHSSAHTAADAPPVRDGSGGGGHAGSAGRGQLAATALGALGVVFGDIGTSPLYAMRETFEGAGHQIPVSGENVLGVLSLIFWSLVIVISIKYVLYVLRADNDGEGGILALTALVPPGNGRGLRVVLLMLGLFGTALLYGDGMITPSISVLAAVEGAELVVPGVAGFIVPIAVAILIGLFAIQRQGTAVIGKLFGPVMLVWFAVLAVLGLGRIVAEPGVLQAVNPLLGARFFADNGFQGFLALGSVFLVVTGGEALYADMGHFGRRPIQTGWFLVALPALLCNYFGQGALLLGTPEAIEAPFYRLAPEWAILPLVLLATAATVIASQALISGVFSLTMQAIQLGYLPRMRIVHTSSSAFGQIYIPAINWGLLAACVALVVGFGSSTALAAAYGVAVTSTMAITTLLLFVVLHERLGWALLPTAALCVAFGVIDLAFFGANLFKIPEGGWFPLVVAAVVFALMTTWRTGKRLVATRTGDGQLTLDACFEELAKRPRQPQRVPGTGVYLNSRPDITPPALLTNIQLNNSLQERVVVLSIVTSGTARVAPANRTEVRPLADGAEQVLLHYGFMETPDVLTGLREGAADPGLDVEHATYFLGSEALVVTALPGMSMWREHLFAFLNRNATPAARYFGLPAERTVILAQQVHL